MEDLMFVSCNATTMTGFPEDGGRHGNPPRMWSRLPLVNVDLNPQEVKLQEPSAWSPCSSHGGARRLEGGATCSWTNSRKAVPRVLLFISASLQTVETQMWEDSVPPGPQTSSSSVRSWPSCGSCSSWSPVPAEEFSPADRNTWLSWIQGKQDHLPVDLWFWFWWCRHLLLGQLHPQLSDPVLLTVECLQELKGKRRQSFLLRRFVPRRSLERPLTSWSLSGGGVSRGSQQCVHRGSCVPSGCHSDRSSSGYLASW